MLGGVVCVRTMLIYGSAKRKGRSRKTQNVPVETNLFSVSTISSEKPGTAPSARAVLSTSSCCCWYLVCDGGELHTFGRSDGWMDGWMIGVCTYTRQRPPTPPTFKATNKVLTDGRTHGTDLDGLALLLLLLLVLFLGLPVLVQLRQRLVRADRLDVDGLGERDVGAAVCVGGSFGRGVGRSVNWMCMYCAGIKRAHIPEMQTRTVEPTSPCFIAV